MSRDGDPLAFLARIAAVGLLAVAAVRAGGTTAHRWLIGLQAVARWALLPAHLLLGYAVLRRLPGLGAVSAALAAYQLGLLRSARARGRPDPLPAGRTPIRILSANLLVTNPDILAAGRQLAAQPIDLLALQELTHEHLAGLRAAGTFAELPYEVVHAEPGFHGAGLFSRWPLRDVTERVLDGDVPLPLATVETPDGPLRIAVVHAKNPGAVGELRRWQRQLRELVNLVAESDLPTVLIGDFNGTADHRDMRKIFTSGLRDVYHIVGRGSGASWPVWPGIVPPLLTLDHALITDGLAASAAGVADTPGSDHRQLNVQLHLTRSEACPTR